MYCSTVDLFSLDILILICACIATVALIQTFHHLQQNFDFDCAFRDSVLTVTVICRWNHRISDYVKHLQHCCTIYTKTSFYDETFILQESLSSSSFEGKIRAADGVLNKQCLYFSVLGILFFGLPRILKYTSYKPHGTWTSSFSYTSFTSDPLCLIWTSHMETNGSQTFCGFISTSTLIAISRRLVFKKLCSHIYSITHTCLSPWLLN